MSARIERGAVEPSLRERRRMQTRHLIAQVALDLGDTPAAVGAEVVLIGEQGDERILAEDLARTVHAHPTLSEVVKEAALATDKRALHM